MDKHRHDDRRAPDWSRINQWVLWAGLAAAVAWLFFRHNEHIVSLVPLLIALACPLMHLFGHGGHRHGSHGDASQGDDAAPGDRHRPGHPG